MTKLLHTGPQGNKSTRANKESTQLCRVVFTTPTGTTHAELVKYQSEKDLEQYIEDFKSSYSPNATFEVQHVNKATISDKIITI